MAMFSFSKWWLSAILDFKKCKILLADGVRRSEMPHCAKFPQNWSIYCRHIEIFYFFSNKAATAFLGM